MIAFRPHSSDVTRDEDAPEHRWKRIVELADAMIDLTRESGSATAEALEARGFDKRELADLGAVARSEAARRERGEGGPAADPSNDTRPS